MTDWNWRRPWRLLPGLIAATVSLSTPAEAKDDECVKVAAPLCVAADATYRDQKAVVACQKDIEHFVTLVYAYRACLARAIASANVEANGAIDGFKCRTGQKSNCERMSPDSGLDHSERRTSVSQAGVPSKAAVATSPKAADKQDYAAASGWTLK